MAQVDELVGLPALEELLHRGLLYEGHLTENELEGEGYSFPREVIREVAYQEAGPTRQRLVHRRAWVMMQQEVRNDQSEEAPYTLPVPIDGHPAVEAGSEYRPKYDRVVFEINGQLPSFLVIHYVPTFTAQGSGKVIPVRGKNILELVMSPAHIFDASGKRTVPPKITCNLPLITEVVSGGEFEATVSFGVGITASHKPEIRVQTLTSPTRVVIDFIRE